MQREYAGLLRLVEENKRRFSPDRAPRFMERIIAVPFDGVRPPFGGDPEPRVMKELLLRKDLIPIWEDVIRGKLGQRIVLSGGPGIGKTVSLNALVLMALQWGTGDIFCHIEGMYFLAILRSEPGGPVFKRIMLDKELTRELPFSTVAKLFPTFDDESSFYFFDTAQRTGERAPTLPIMTHARTVVAASFCALDGIVYSKYSFRQVRIPDPSVPTFFELAQALGFSRKEAAFSLAFHGPMLRTLGAPRTAADLIKDGEDIRSRLKGSLARSPDQADDSNPSQRIDQRSASGKMIGYNVNSQFFHRPLFHTRCLREVLHQLDPSGVVKLVKHVAGSVFTGLFGSEIRDLVGRSKEFDVSLMNRWNEMLVEVLRLLELRDSDVAETVFIRLVQIVATSESKDEAERRLADARLSPDWVTALPEDVKLAAPGEEERAARDEKSGDERWDWTDGATAGAAVGSEETKRAPSQAGLPSGGASAGAAVKPKAFPLRQPEVAAGGPAAPASAAAAAGGAAAAGAGAAAGAAGGAGAAAGAGVGDASKSDCEDKGPLCTMS